MTDEIIVIAGLEAYRRAYERGSAGTIVMGVRLPAETRAALDTIASAEGTDATSLVRRLIKNRLEAEAARIEGHEPPTMRPATG